MGRYEKMRRELAQRVKEGEVIYCNNGACRNEAVYWGYNPWLALACDDCASSYAREILSDLEDE